TAAAGAAMAVSILAGHPQTAIYVFYMAIAYWIYRTRGLSLSKGRGAVCPLSSILRHPLLYLIVFVFFALGLSAIQWLPTLEFTRFSTRAQVNYAFTSHGFAPYEIVTLLIPGYLGGSPLYIGIIPMLLAVAAFDDRAGAKPHAGGLLVDAVMRARGFAPTAAFFWLLTAFVALLLSFGDALFAYPLAYLFAPGFAQVRDQERIALLWSFALAMLAALGAARLGRPFSRAARVRLAGVERRLGGLTAGLVALIALAYGGMLASADQKVNLFPGALRQLVPAFFWLAAAWGLWRLRLHVAVSRRWLMIATLGLIGLNLFSVNAPSHFQQPTPSDYYPETTLVQTLRAELKAHPLARVASEGLLPGAHNAGADFDFQEITGNDPLQLAETAQFDRTMQELRKWQLLGVRYIITRREIAHGAFSLVASEGEAHLYRNAEALPRAWLVHAVEVVPADVYGVLNRPDFDPAQVVALNAEPPIALPASAPAASPVEVAAYAPGRLSLRARAAANGLLVIGEVYYPGWQAVVDGQRAPLLRADSILMAVPLSAGPHQVELTFEPDSVKIGGLISGLTLLAWLVIIARSGILTLPRHRTPIR
ncbi:MAG: YfhO family protein, partial [Chloroflexi bacterium]|nr:YfhO family protein [Chloroflexota bacterium]